MLKNILLLCLKNKKPVKSHQNCPKFQAIPEIIINKKKQIRCYNCKFLYKDN